MVRQLFFITAIIKKSKKTAHLPFKSLSIDFFEGSTIMIGGDS